MYLTLAKRKRLFVLPFLAALLLVSSLSFSFPVLSSAPTDFNVSFLEQYDNKTQTGEFGAFSLLYPKNALEPYINSATMELHYEKHYRGYVKKLNTALDKYPYLKDKSLPYLQTHLSEIPEDIVSDIINNGGGKLNHDLYFDGLSPQGGGKPKGLLLEAIEQSFGSFENFQAEFTSQTKSQFGSGWGWLVVNPATRGLAIVTTANQDNPLLDKKIPLLGCDKWEHAYYLMLQNLVDKYIKNWWQIVDWQKIEARYEAALN